MQQGRALAVLVADILNQALEKNPDVIGELIDLRMPAPKALAEYPNVQVFKDQEGVSRVSIMGLLNGFFDGWAVAYYPKEIKENELKEKVFSGEFRVIRIKRKK